MSLSKETIQLPERSLQLFKALVERFIQDGHPVGSRVLARDTDLELSPATIRNVMADLEDLGLLRSPHTSAGRIPTAKGYRLFVDSLLCVHDPDLNEIEKIAREMESEQDMKSLLNRTSSLLSDITRLVSVVMLPRSDQPMLKHVEFMNLSDNRVLVILIVSDREIQNRIIQTSRVYSAAELQQASNYLNRVFSGKELNRVRSDLIRDLEQMKDDVSQLMQMAIEMAQKAFISGEIRDDYVLSGQTNLMNVAELCDLEKLRKLFESFNQKRDILHLLEQSIHANGVQIFIGEESGYEVLDDCSIVTSPYEVDGQILGVLGVIGPTRMQYDRIIPIVDITAKMLGSALNSRN